MVRAGGPASSAAGAVMQTGRAACACKGVGKATVANHCLVADLGAQRSLGSHLPTGVSTLRRDPACFAVLCVAVDAITVRGDPLRAFFSRQTGTGRDDSCRQSQHQDRRREEINSPQV